MPFRFSAPRCCKCLCDDEEPTSRSEQNDKADTSPLLLAAEHVSAPAGNIRPAVGLDVVTQDLKRSIRELKSVSLPPGAAEACEFLTKGATLLDEALARTKASQGIRTRGLNMNFYEVNSEERMAPKTTEFLHDFEPAINKLVAVMWPRLDNCVKTLVADKVQPEIDKQLPNILKGHVNFTKVSLGESWPSIGPMVVEVDPETQEIEVQVGVDVRSSLDVEVRIMGITVGLSEISFKANIIVHLNAPSAEAPFARGIQLFCLDPPDVNIGFSGAARLATFPGFNHALRTSLDTALGESIVLPHRVAIDLSPEDDIDAVDMAHPPPFGILRLTLHSGSDLIASDENLFSAPSSDPYVEASLGAKTWMSPVIKACLNPVWGGAAGLSVDFPVHHRHQKLILKVYDEDHLKKDDLIGVAEHNNVKQLIDQVSAASIDIPLRKADGEPGAGYLTVATSFLHLKAEKPDPPLSLDLAPGLSASHLSVKILTIHGLGQGREPPYKVQIRVRAHVGTKTASGRRPELSKLAGSCFSGVSAIRKRRGLTPLGLDGLDQAPVQAEGSTRPSFPKPLNELQDANRNICLALADRGYKPSEIAEILDLAGDAKVKGIDKAWSRTASDKPDGEFQVENFLLSTKGTEEAEAALWEASEKQQQRNARRHPILEDVVHLLLPPGCEHGVVELAIFDRHLLNVATAFVKISQIIQTPECFLSGPFTTNDKPRLIGSMKWRWVHARD